MFLYKRSVQFDTRRVDCTPVKRLKLDPCQRAPGAGCRGVKLPWFQFQHVQSWQFRRISVRLPTPRPNCDGLAWLAWQSSPNVELHQSASASSIALALLVDAQSFRLERVPGAYA